MSMVKKIIRGSSIALGRIIVAIIVVSCVPKLALAATPQTFPELVNVFIGIINLIIPLLFFSLFIFLIWKLIDAWILNVADEKKRTEGKAYALAAVLVFVLGVSTWGIVQVLSRSVFGV